MGLAELRGVLPDLVAELARGGVRHNNAGPLVVSTKFSFFCLRILMNPGSKNANVFPLPVLATPTRSLPETSAGHA